MTIRSAILRILGGTAVLLVLLGWYPATSLADSCDSWSCGAGCIAPDCVCGKQGGTSGSAVNFDVSVSTQYQAALCPACGGSGQPTVQVTAQFGFQYDIRQVFVIIRDFNNTVLWQNPNVNCGSSTCVITSPPLGAEPRVVLATAFGNVSNAPPGSSDRTAQDILCINGGPICPACCTNPGVCNDGNACTQDACNPSAGCTHTPLTNQPCNDGKPCTTGDHCNASGQCVGTNTCDDSNPCTNNTCTTSGCQFTPKPAGTQCRENPDNPCTGGGPNQGTCNSNGICGGCLNGQACVLGCGGGTCGRVGTVCSCR